MKPRGSIFIIGLTVACGNGSDPPGEGDVGAVEDVFQDGRGPQDLSVPEDLGNQNGEMDAGAMPFEVVVQPMSAFGCRQSCQAEGADCSDRCQGFVGAGEAVLQDTGGAVTRSELGCDDFPPRTRIVMGQVFNLVEVRCCCVDSE